MGGPAVWVALAGSRHGQLLLAAPRLRAQWGALLRQEPPQGPRPPQRIPDPTTSPAEGGSSVGRGGPSGSSFCSGHPDRQPLPHLPAAAAGEATFARHRSRPSSRSICPAVLMGSHVMTQPFRTLRKLLMARRVPVAEGCGANSPHQRCLEAAFPGFARHTRCLTATTMLTTPPSRSVAATSSDRAFPQRVALRETVRSRILHRQEPRLPVRLQRKPAVRPWGTLCWLQKGPRPPRSTRCAALSP